MSVSNSFISVETVMPGAHLRGVPLSFLTTYKYPLSPNQKTLRKSLSFIFFPLRLKYYNFSVWKNIWSDFQGKCPFLIRSFPGYFVVGIISGGGTHLLTYSYPLSQTRPFRKTSSFFVKITLLILILALKTCRDLSLRVFTMACSFIIFLRLDLWDSILVSLKLRYEHT